MLTTGECCTTNCRPRGTRGERIDSRTVDPEEPEENVSTVEEVLEQRASIEEREVEAFDERVRAYNGTDSGTEQIRSVYNQIVRDLRRRQNSDLRRHRYEQVILKYLGDSFLKKHNRINVITWEAREEKRKHDIKLQSYNREQLMQRRSRANYREVTNKLHQEATGGVHEH